MAKNVNARVVQKHDSLENWKKATGFVPMKGEFFLVDDYDYPVIIGDGVTPASELCLEPMISIVEDSQIDSLFAEVELITFILDTSDLTSDGILTFVAPKGYTWEEFINSEYNNENKFTLLQDQYVHFSGYFITDTEAGQDGVVIATATSVIFDGQQYRLTAFSGGSN